ncbi:hypothetical protein [Bradyrhizobium sp. AUGA SZCCT0160]|uniref:hypothetical protein n=1 Tax=Bradyrhizobium sp. AUGA SZCCT0160 TaxID=2807662 RepID=UPI001BAE5438|nr:hypothetical protein [Bradyrhizobium sp. AUGA SZCCT0160]MBR1190612.1 hypothetical protein [Bradyrhizobium sp. AUGA SZCCT0160]
MTNNQIENVSSHDSVELSLDDLVQVTGGGDFANAVAYLAGNVIGGAAYLVKNFAGKLR